MATTSSYLSFVERIPGIELSDPLGELLGALPPGGTFRYSYEDVAKLCGHSCPTVAGAWLMTVAALRALYGDATPERGAIAVVVGGSPSDGVSGPISQVIGLVTGAAPDTGFGGIGGRYRRMDLLAFDPSLGGRIRFRRTDTGATVETAYHPGRVPPAPEMPGLMRKALGGDASVAERSRFAALWQARVADILSGDPSRVVTVTPG